MSRPKGFKHSDETRQKMREHYKGFNRPHTEAERVKVSESLKEWHRKHPHVLKGRKASAETRQKMSLARRGSDNANWKGGLTKLVKGIRRSPEFYQWRKAVLERDNHTCKDCGETANLNAHHIFSIIDYPQRVFDVDNGLTLCDGCHKKHTWWQRIRPQTKKEKAKCRKHK